MAQPPPNPFGKPTGSPSGGSYVFGGSARPSSGSHFGPGAGLPPPFGQGSGFSSPSATQWRTFAPSSPAQEPKPDLITKTMDAAGGAGFPASLMSDPMDQPVSKKSIFGGAAGVGLSGTTSGGSSIFVAPKTAAAATFGSMKSSTGDGSGQQFPQQLRFTIPAAGMSVFGAKGSSMPDFTPSTMEGHKDEDVPKPPAFTSLAFPGQPVSKKLDVKEPVLPSVFGGRKEGEQTRPPPVFGASSASEGATFGSSIFGGKKTDQPVFGGADVGSSVFASGSGFAKVAASRGEGPVKEPSGLSQGHGDTLGKVDGFQYVGVVKPASSYASNVGGAVKPTSGSPPFKMAATAPRPVAGNYVSRSILGGSPTAGFEPRVRSEDSIRSATKLEEPEVEIGNLAAPSSSFKEGGSRIFGRSVAESAVLRRKEGGEHSGVDDDGPAPFRRPPPPVLSTRPPRLLELPDTSRPPPPVYEPSDVQHEEIVDNLSAKSRLGSRMRRTSLTDELLDVKSLQLRNLPRNSNERNYLRQLFSPFGTIVRIQSLPAKGLAYIHYDSHDAARLAKRSKGRIFPDNPEISVHFSKSVSPRNRAVAVASARNAAAAVVQKAAKQLSSQMESRVDRFGDKAHDQASSTVTMGPVEKQFLEVIALPAVTDTERLRVLDVRDRLLKAYREKKRTLSKYFVGTCPDMCPERERYLRSSKNLLSFFEKAPASEDNIPGAFHRYCVKEYSRSSADQEEPLPHDLRPLPTLEKTMLYLLSNVVDALDSNPDETPISEWYNFLWDRTRAIRKDVTQQHLSGAVAVDLTEICVRFHIMACAVMADQPRQVFDQKINDENLTKSLTTVLQMYDDARSENFQFSNEAEFRAYHVLLNANRGDTLRKIQALDPVIRSAPLVQMSIKLCRALNSRNYIRFFRLVRDPEMPYLAGALLLRYFTQIRTQALRLLVYALTPTKKSPVKLALSDLKQWLGFDDEGDAEVIAFCEAHGLEVQTGGLDLGDLVATTGEDSDAALRCVVLDRNVFQSPAETLQLSPYLVQLKKGDQVLSQILLGGKRLPGSSAELVPEPHDSFDSSGFLKKGSKFARDQGCTIEVPASAIDSGASVSSRLSVPSLAAVRRTSPMRDGHVPSGMEPHAEDMAAKLARERMKEQQLERLKELQQQREARVRINVKFSEECATELLNAVVDENLRDIAKVAKKEALDAELEIRLEKERLEEEEAKKRAALKLGACSSFLDAIVTEILPGELRGVAKSALTAEVEELRSIGYSNVAPQYANDLLHELVTDEIHRIAEEEYGEQHAKWERSLAGVQAIRERRLVKHFFHKWKRIASVRIFKRGIELALRRGSFLPPGLRPPGTVSPGFPTYTQLLACAEKQVRAHGVIEEHANRRRACSSAVWAPYDLCDLFERIVVPRVREQSAGRSERGSKAGRPLRVSLKLSLLLSRGLRRHDGRKSDTWSGWLAAKFREPSAVDQRVSDVVLLKTGLVSRDVSSPSSSSNILFDLCVRIDDLPFAASTASAVDVSGSTAFMIFVEYPFSPDDMAGVAAAFVECLFPGGLPRRPSVPVTLTLCGSGKMDEYACMFAADVFQLEKLRATGYVSDFVVNWFSAERGLVTCSEKLANCVHWILKRTPVLYEPEIRAPLPTFVANFVKQHILPLVVTPSDERDWESPGMSALVDLFNSGIDHLIVCIDNKDIRSLTWPSREIAAASTAKRDQIPKASATSPYPLGDWNSDARLRRVTEALRQTKLPPLRQDKTTDSWDSVREGVWSYVDSLVGSRRVSKNMQIIFYSEIRRILKAAIQEVRKLRLTLKTSDVADSSLVVLDTDESTWYPSWTGIPWPQIFYACYSFVLNSLASDPLSDDPEVMAVCFRAQLESFKASATWYRGTRRRRSKDTTLKERSFTRDETTTVSKRKMEPPALENETAVSQENKKRKLSPADEMFAKIRAEKLREEDFEMRLKRAIGEGDCDEELLESPGLHLRVPALSPVTSIISPSARSRGRLSAAKEPVCPRPVQESSFSNEEGRASLNPSPEEFGDLPSVSIAVDDFRMSECENKFRALIDSARRDMRHFDTLEASFACELDE